MNKKQEIEDSRRQAFASYRKKHGRGCLAELGRRLTPVASNSWMSQLASGKPAIPIEIAVQLEQLTGGEISRKQLFPDTWEKIWPELAAVAA